MSGIVLKNREVRSRHDLTVEKLSHLIHQFLVRPTATLTNELRRLFFLTERISRRPAPIASQFPGGISAAQLTTANNLLALLGGVAGTVDQTFNTVTPTSDFVPISLVTLNLGARYEKYVHSENIMPFRGSSFSAESWWKSCDGTLLLRVSRFFQFYGT